MESLNIIAQSKTPLIDFNPIEGKMIMKGMSSAENSLDFYRPILKWIDVYSKNITTNEINIEIYFKYFNTSSAKCILDLLERFVNITNFGTFVSVNWKYDTNDEEMLEAGENFSEILDFRFKFEPI